MSPLRKRSGRFFERNNVSAKLLVMNTKEKTFVLKRCASANGLTSLNLNNLSLREAKSYAGALADPKLYNLIPTQLYQNMNENCLELFCKDYDKRNEEQKSITTVDAVTGEVFLVNEQSLICKGKTYTAEDIASSWKKDCRMWMWKNNKEFKKNRSVAEKDQKTAAI